MTERVESGARCCDECGRVMARATRVEDGHAYCMTCYVRVFKRVPCSSCGRIMRARDDGREPICAVCRRKDCVCYRCGKPVERAGRIVSGRVVCASCAPYYSELKPCTCCGRLSRRLSRAPEAGFDEPVCDRCRNRHLETCSVCRRYRKVAHRDDEGRPVCLQCAEDDPVQHACPTCGALVPGGGQSQCSGCALKDRVRRRVRLNVELLEQSWVRSLFEGFSAWEGLRKEAGNMTARIDRYAVFFAEIDRTCKEPREVTQRRLFELFEAEGLRRGFQAVSFLCERLGLDWDAAALEDLIEARRIQVQARAWRDQPWAEGLQRYVEELDKSGSPRLRRKTLRGYQTAAGGLMEIASVDSVGALTQAHVDRYLKRNPGQAANLSPFIRHLKECLGIALEARKKPATPLHMKDKALVQRVRSLTRRIEGETDGRAARALLVGLLANLYQVPVKDVLALTSADVFQDQGAFVLWPGARDVRVDGRLAELFKQWVPNLQDKAKRGLLFSGRNGVQPLSYDAVRYHVELAGNAVWI